jgi:cyclase
MRMVSARNTCAIILLVMAAALSGSAQYQQSGKVSPNDGMTWQLVKTGLYVISGQGGNSVLRLSGNGLILVDGKLPASYDALRARVKKISNQPVRVVILTDCNPARTGTNVKFMEDGTTLVVQDNAVSNSVPCQPAAQKSTTPIITYAKDYPIHLGGVDVQLMHFGNGYSKNDTVVYFPNLKVVALGDLYASTPEADFAAGGSLVEWGRVLGEILKLDFDVAVPSNGPVITRADLEVLKNKIDTMVARATGLVKQGIPKDQLMARLKTADPGWQLNYTGDQLDGFYADLSRTK